MVKIHADLVVAVPACAHQGFPGKKLWGGWFTQLGVEEVERGHARQIGITNRNAATKRILKNYEFFQKREISQRFGQLAT